MNGNQILAWAGPEPVRADTVSVRLEPDRLTAVGSSTTAERVVAYRLETAAGWVTRRLSVDVHEHDGRCRSLDLWRDPAGAWSATRDGVDLVLPALDGALDCDLALCPLTNSMPVLRHGLVAAARAGDTTVYRMRMAWVSLPDLDVHASGQQYRALHPVVGGGAVVGFASDGFDSTIEVDSAGLVVNYPSIGRRLLTRSG